MIHIPKGTSKPKIKSVIRHELYKEKFLRQMREFAIYFNALEKAKWMKQKIDYRTDEAREAEKRFLAERKEKRYDRL